MKFLEVLFSTFTIAVIVFLFGCYEYGIMAFGHDNKSTLASVFFSQSVTSAELHTTFDATSSVKKKINVLIVPGHEPDFGGTEYVNIKERDIAVDLGLELARYLVEDGHFDVTMTRGKESWNKEFQDYFVAHYNEIVEFVRFQKTEMARLVSEGRIIAKQDNISHNDAPDDVALRLYGINKWANEHNVDIVIHIHFNDNFPRPEYSPGEYNGLVVYVPDSQYSNAGASKEIAQYVFGRLSHLFPVSSLPEEHEGVVEDQKLIAVGSYNTADPVSILVEYGYIYEPQFQISSVRALAVKELAFQTYLGLADFFGETVLATSPYQSTLLPYDVKKTVRKTTRADTDTFKLQVALADKGFYPPRNRTKNDCPPSGILGQCTRAALTDFQNKFGIKGEEGVAGAKTNAKLRALFHEDVVGVR